MIEREKLISVQLAKRISQAALEKGFELVDGAYWWVLSLEGVWTVTEDPDLAIYKYREQYCAFDLHDLFEMMPHNSALFKGNPDGSFTNEEVRYSGGFQYLENGEACKEPCCHYKVKPAEALGEQLFHCLEGDLMNKNKV